MIQRHGVLIGLVHQLVGAVERRCGVSLYVVKLAGYRWGVYKHPGRRGNVCNIIERQVRDKYFPRCPLPHLKIATYYALATKAGVTPQVVLPEAFHNRPGAYWCVSMHDHAQLARVAQAISQMYPHVH